MPRGVYKTVFIIFFWREEDCFRFSVKFLLLNLRLSNLARFFLTHKNTTFLIVDLFSFGRIENEVKGKKRNKRSLWKLLLFV